MKNATVDLLNEEEQTINDRLAKDSTPLSFFQKSKQDLIDLVQNTIQDTLKKYFDVALEKALPASMDKATTVKIEGKPEVVVEFPPIQKVSGFETIIKALQDLGKNLKLPDILTVKGSVKADVEFPPIQKVEGKVKAEVVFPPEQKVEIINKMFDREGRIKTNIPIGAGGGQSIDKADPTIYVPVRLTNGKQFYEVLSQVAHAAKQLTTQLSESSQSVVYSNTKRITVSGTTYALGTADIKTIVVQALKDNIDAVYVNGAYELQAGQPVTIVIDNLSKVTVRGSYPNDGVCYIAS